MIPSKCHFVLCVQRALVRWQSSARRHRIQPSLGQGHQGLVPPRNRRCTAPIAVRPHALLSWSDGWSARLCWLHFGCVARAASVIRSGQWFLSRARCAHPRVQRHRLLLSASLAGLMARRSDGYARELPVGSSLGTLFAAAGVGPLSTLLAHAGPVASRCWRRAPVPLLGAAVPSGAMGLLAWLSLSRLLVCRGTARRISWMLPVWLQVGPVAVSVTRRGGQLHHGNANGHVLHRMR